MDSTNDSRLESFLANIANTSNLILQTVAPGASPGLTSSHYTLNPPVLPCPPDVLPELEATGAPAPMIAELLKWYNKSCRSLRRQTEATVANLPVKSSRAIRLFEEAYLKRSYALKDRILQRVYNASNRKCVKFNQKYTPLLEKYFKGNAYPSAADRAMLAQQTHMTARQIDVWFQNHRARGKRDGIILQRRSSDANPDDYTLDSLEHTTSPPSRRSRSTSNAPLAVSDKDNHPENAPNRSTPLAAVFQWISYTPVDIVKVPPPPHAFPTPFSSKDPLPLPPCVPAFDWTRKPFTASKSTSKPKQIDVDTFIDDFKMQLRIFEQPQTSSLKRKRSSDSIDSPVPPRKKIMTLHSTLHELPSTNTSQSPTRPQSVRPSATHARPPRRTIIPVPRRPSSTPISRTSSRSFSGSSDSSSSTLSSSNRSRSASSTSPVAPFTSMNSNTVPPASLLSHHFFGQRLSWHTSKFAQWSSLPALTLNYMPSTFPASLKYS